MKAIKSFFKGIRIFFKWIFLGKKPKSYNEAIVDQLKQNKIRIYKYKDSQSGRRRFSKAPAIKK